MSEHDTDRGTEAEAHAAAPAEDADKGLEAEVADLKDRLLRAMADAENLRRRSEREVQDAHKYAITKFARDLLSVADNFSRALGAVSPELREQGGEAVTNLLTGVELTERELVTVFKRYGIERLEPKGERFDPNFHQAIAEIPHPTVEAGLVVDVAQSGYRIADRLLRPAMVIVSKGGGNGASVDTKA